MYNMRVILSNVCMYVFTCMQIFKWFKRLTPWSMRFFCRRLDSFSGCGAPDCDEIIGGEACWLQHSIVGVSAHF